MVADTDNNRVLIWNSIPTTNGANADLVLGQDNFTTVRQPIVEKGRLAARLLIQSMKGKAVDSPAPLRTTLVVRNSTSRVTDSDLPIKRR